MNLDDEAMIGALLNRSQMTLLKSIHDPCVKISFTNPAGADMLHDLLAKVRDNYASELVAMERERNAKNE